MTEIKLIIGPVRVNLRERHVMLARRGSPNHFSLFTEPRETPEGPRFTPHITYRSRGRRWLPRFSREELQAFVDGPVKEVWDAIAWLWVARTTPVCLRDLETKGWYSTPPFNDVAMVERFRMTFEGKGGTLRFARDSPEKMLDLVEDSLEPISAAARYRDASSLMVAIQLVECGIEKFGYLSYFPKGLRGLRDGWFMTPHDYVTVDELLAIVEPHREKFLPILESLKPIMQLLRLDNLGASS